MSQPSQPLSSVLVKIDKYATDSDREKLYLLATAVIPYGKVETLKGVPELFRCLKRTQFSENAVDLLQRMLSKAGFRSDHVSWLDEHVAKPKDNFQQLPDMYFQELLISVADELGNGDYLTQLVYVIPEEKIGVSPDSINSAVQLFQRLLHEQTISADNQSTLNDLAQWLQDIGRKDIAKRLFGFGTAVQEQGGLAKSVQPEQEHYPQQESGGNTDEGITKRDALVGQQQQCVTGTGSKVLEVRVEDGPHRGPETAKGVESGRTGLGGAMQQFAGNPDIDTQVGSINDLETDKLLKPEADTAGRGKVGRETENKMVKDEHGCSQSSRTATIKRALCYIFLVALTIFCFCCVAQSAAVATVFGTHINPASVSHLGFNGDTIVCDQTEAQWYSDWTVSECLMQGDYNYDVQACVVEQSELRVYNRTTQYSDSNFSQPTAGQFNLPVNLNRMPYLLKGSRIKMEICLQSFNTTTTPARVYIFENRALNQKFLDDGTTSAVYSKIVPVGNSGQVKCTNVSYVAENPEYHYVTLATEGKVTITENIAIEVMYVNMSDCEGRRIYTVTTAESHTIAVPSNPAVLLCFIPKASAHAPIPYTTHMCISRSLTRIIIVLAVECGIGAISLIVLFCLSYCVVTKLLKSKRGGLESCGESKYGSVTFKSPRNRR